MYNSTTSSGFKRTEFPVGNLPVWITHIPDGAVLRNDDNHAFWVLTAEPVRGSVPCSGLIRALFDKLRSFKIERSVDNFTPVTRAMNFCPEPDDIPGAGHHQSTVNRHEIGKEMCALKNRLVQSRQTLVLELLVIFPSDCLQAVFSSHLRQRPHYGEEEFARTMTGPSLFNPIFRPDRAYRIDNLRCVFCSDDNKHAAMLGASDLADYPASEVLAKHLDEIRFDGGAAVVILKTFSNCPLGEGLLRFLQPTRFINIKSMTFQPAIQQRANQAVTARNDQVPGPADIDDQTIWAGWTLQAASVDSGNPAGAGV